MKESEKFILTDPESHRGYQIEKTDSGIYKVGYPIATDTLHHVNLQVLLPSESEVLENLQSPSPDATGLRLLLPEDKIVTSAILYARTSDTVYYQPDYDLIDKEPSTKFQLSSYQAHQELGLLGFDTVSNFLINPGYPYSMQFLLFMGKSSVAIVERGTGGLSGSNNPIRAVWYSQKAPERQS